MRWFHLLPLSALVLLAGIVGIMQLRDQAGVQSGYLMAGACLILSGLLAAQSLIGRSGDGASKDVEELRKQVAALSATVDRLSAQMKKDDRADEEGGP